MRSGDMDRKIIIQSRTLSKNASGEAEETWATFATVWAQKLDFAGKEYFAAKQVNSEVSTKFKIRWLSGLKMEMRISFDSIIYDIQSIAELGRREGIEIMAEAKRE